MCRLFFTTLIGSRQIPGPKRASQLIIWVSLIACIFFAADLKAQISGKVTGSDAMPIIGVTISLRSLPDSVIVRSAVSDTNGVFALPAPAPGRYFVVITSAGYVPWSSLVVEVVTERLSYELGNIILQARPEQLEGVAVRASRLLVTQNAYGTTVNANASLLLKGSSVLELLSRAPGVWIDERNNAVTLNGRSGVLIMINGKILRMPMSQVLTMLSAMSANDIDRIELLTTPPASFDAEGSAGIINIITKKHSMQGAYGTLNISGGLGWAPKAMLSGSFSLVKRKWDLHGSYTYSSDKTISDLYIVSAQTMPLFGGNMEVTVWDTSKAQQYNHNASMNFNYRPDTATSFGISLSANLSDRKLGVVNHSDYRLLPDSMLFFDGNIKNVNSWKDYSASVSAARQYKNHGKLSATVDLMFFDNNNPSIINTTLRDVKDVQVITNDTLFSPAQRGSASTNIRVAVGRADYERMIGKTKLETGVKANVSESKSSSGIESLVNNRWVHRNETLNNIKMNEYIAAGYSSLTVNPSPAINIIMSARYEFARTRMTDGVGAILLIDRKLARLFPGLFVNLRAGDDLEWQLSYTERIARPTYNDLASFMRYSDATAIYTGNPALRPTTTRNLKAGIVFKKYSAALMASRDEHPIAYYQLTESPGGEVLYVSPQNLRYQNYLNLQLNLPTTITGWWNSSINIVTGWRQLAVQHTKQPVKKAYFTYSFNFNQSLRLPKNFSAEVSGWFSSFTFNGTVKVSRMGAVNAGIKKELNKNHGKLQLSVTDIFSTIRVHSYFGAFAQEAFNISNHVIYSGESGRAPVFRLSFTRSFGKNLKAGVAGKTVEEIERVRKD